MSNSYGRSLTIGAVIVIIAVTLFTVKSNGKFSTSGMIAYQIDSGVLGVAGSGKGDFIPLSDITSVELIQEFDMGQPCTEEEKSRVHIGRYYNDEFGDYSLYAYDDVDALIVISHTGGVTVFNLDTAEATESACQELLDTLASQ